MAGKKLSDLPNIGRAVEEQLIAAGIETEEQLRALGSRQAWLKLKTMDPSACYNRLCALEGAIRGIRWHDLPEQDKRELKEFYLSFKG